MRESHPRRWQFLIDRGGTFTDCLGVGPLDGRVLVTKVLSCDRAPLEGIRKLLGLGQHEPIPACDVRMGTTLATNALLERKGKKTALVISEGFGDLLSIGDQSRPDLFALEIRKPTVLYEAVLELSARCSADGHVLERPDPRHVRTQLELLRQRGIESLAIVLMHAYRASALELELAAIAQDLGFAHVSVSHQVAAELGLLARGDTTVLDAYLTPLIHAYVEGLLAELPGSNLRIMQSSGGLSDARSFRGRDAILSGPAGGAVAVAGIARQHGLSQVIGFDMGGTSTDVSRFEGEIERIYESKIAGVCVRAPMMSIHTVAAGGGSICRYDGRRFSVGPDSAGATPGPLCYGRPEATELTLTDVSLTLGRLLPDRFPFALDGERPLRALERVAAELGARGDARSAHAVATGFFEVAIERMAEAIHRVSVARGHDVRDHALIAFGGAAGQHACALARRLEIRTIIFHRFAGVLSAYGMGLADGSWHGQEDAGRYVLEAELPNEAERTFEALGARGEAKLAADGWSHARIERVRRADLRYRGGETALTLRVDEDARAGSLRVAFETAHRRCFGYARSGHPIEVVTLRVEVIARAPTQTVSAPEQAHGGTSEPTPLRHSGLFLDGSWVEVPVYPREGLAPGHVIRGPAIVCEDTGTIVVDPGFALRIGAEGVVVLSDLERSTRVGRASTVLDPVRLEVFSNLFMSIAEQMGVVLQRTALSTNIRERLDFSCAVFDRDGGLVANAPHIPVHLGAMSESVRAMLELHRDMQPGDIFATNDPSLGGSHLPDVTLITPVFDDDEKLLFFSASRGHHADIGGITPGSMPPFSTTLAQEGVVLHGLRIVQGGRLDQELLWKVLSSGPYPARDPTQNLADLQAQIAANRKGEELLLALLARYGLDVVLAYMGHVQDNAQARVCDAIAALDDGSYACLDHMDDGTPIGVSIQIAGEHMSIDFSGSGAQVAGNLNAPRSVTLAAVLYVLRVLVGEPIPLNGGCLRPISLVIPQGSVLSPEPGAAVAAGNVETSQRVVDVLLGALGKLAASQGTMNNLTFGDSSFGYYETIAGGAGASQNRDGASGVHTHMTNTRITDPEVLEAAFPVRVLRFAYRRGSGGRGRHRGGDGLVRELQALTHLQASILSERRVTHPFGLEGGAPGARGRNFHNDIAIGGRAELELAPFDRIRIETPGGGGFGSA